MKEIALATYNGEVIFFRASGYMMSDKLEVPRLKAKRDWYVGLLPDPVDHSHPDVHDEQLIKEAVMHSVPTPTEANHTSGVEEKANHTSSVEEKANHISGVEEKASRVEEKANHTSGVEENKGKESEMHPIPEPPKIIENTAPEEHVRTSQNESDATNTQNKTSPHIELPTEIHNTSSNAAPDNVEGTNSDKKTGRRLLEEKTLEDNVVHEQPYFSHFYTWRKHINVCSCFGIWRDSIVWRILF